MKSMQALVAGTLVGVMTLACAPTQETKTDAGPEQYRIEVLNGDNQTAGAGGVFGRPLEVHVTDSTGSNVVNARVHFSAPNSDPKVLFGMSSFADVPSTISGIATAPPCIAGDRPGDVTVTATMENAGTVTFSLHVTRGAAHDLDIVDGSGQFADVETAFAMPMKVHVGDIKGNAIPGADITFTTPDTQPFCTFEGGAHMATVTTNTLGVAEAPPCTTGTKSGVFPVYVSSSLFAFQTTFNMGVRAGAAVTSEAVMDTSPTAGAGTAFPNAFQVLVKDAHGNGVPGVAVAFTTPEDGATCAFPNSMHAATSVTGSEGTALSPFCTASGTLGMFMAQATVDGLGTTFQFNREVVAGPAKVLVLVQGGGQSAQAGMAFPLPIQVRVEDGFQHVLAAQAVTFKAPATGSRCAFGGDAMASSQSGMDGVAVAPSCLAAGPEGMFNLQASLAGMMTPLDIPLSVTP